MVADAFENFRNTCSKKYELDLASFFTAPGLAWQVDIKKTKVKLDLLTKIDMLLIVDKDFRDGICHDIHLYMEGNNKQRIVIF